jgi:chemotaxis protein MotB
MKTALSIAFASLLLTSCVSSKKYSALESEVEQLRTSQNILSALQNQANPERDGVMQEDPRVDDLSMQLKDAHNEIRQLNEQIKAANMPPLSMEQLGMLDQERMQQHELDMMKMHQESQGTESREAIAKNETQLKNANTAATIAMEPYKNGEVLVELKGSKMIITVKDNALFSSDKSSISASGQTFINRFLPVLEVSRGLTLYIVGISDNDEGKLSASNKAAVLDKDLLKSSTYKSFDAMIGAQICENAASGRKTNCDKVEIIIETNNEEALNLMRIGK